MVSSLVDEKEKKDFQRLVGKIEDRMELKGTKQEVDNALRIIEAIDHQLVYDEGISAPMTDTTIEEADKIILKSGFTGLLKKEKKGWKARSRGDSGGSKDSP